MSKQQEEVKRNYYRIAISDDLNNEIARVQGWGGSWSCLSPANLSGIWFVWDWKNIK